MADQPQLPQYPGGPHPSVPGGQDHPGPYPPGPSPSGPYPAGPYPAGGGQPPPYPGGSQPGPYPGAPAQPGPYGGAGQPAAYPGGPAQPGPYQAGPYPGGPAMGPPPGTPPSWGQQALPAWGQPASAYGAPPAKPGRPSPVTNAVRLMWVGAVLTFAGIAIGVTQRSTIRTKIEQKKPNLSPSQVNTDVNVAIALVLILAIVAGGLWVMCAIATSKGHRWGRVVGTVFWGIDTLLILVSLGNTNTSASVVGDAIGWVLGLIVVVLLWQKQASAYFSASANYRRSGGR